MGLNNIFLWYRLLGMGFFYHTYNEKRPNMIFLLGLGPMAWSNLYIYFMDMLDL